MILIKRSISQSVSESINELSKNALGARSKRVVWPGGSHNTVTGHENWS